MEGAAAPSSGVVNMTRALEAVSPMLNNPRKTIIRVEVLVSVVAALLFLQFILDFCKRLRLGHNGIVSFVLKVCDQAMFPLIFYTLSVMQTSPIKNSVYPVWAVSLIIASGAKGIIKQHDRPMSFFIEVARYTFYFFMFSLLIDPKTPKSSSFWWQFYRTKASSTCIRYLFGLVVLSKTFEGFGKPLFELSSWYIAKWTKNYLNNNDDDQNDCDPKSMNDYNYLVSYPLGNLFKKMVTDKAPSNENVITVDQIWDCFHNSDDKETLKDVCLSFALFQLLKRRYFGWACGEASLRKTRDFVFKVLLPHPDDDYKRAFRIVETELGFCYDFLFTKHPLSYAAGLSLPLWIVWFVFFLGKISLIFVVVFYALKKSLILETPTPIIEVHSAKADYIIALSFLCIILMVKLLETTFYHLSDWFKVSLTCTYVKRKNCAPIAFILEKALCFLNRITISARCRNTIDQYSIISGRGWRLLWIKMMSPSVEVSDAVKKAIANSLISSQGELTKGERALRMFADEYSVMTLKDHSQIEVMLIWHIATDYCALVVSDDGEDRDVAVHLSRYYAYLIAFVPELLPHHVGDIKELRITVWEEVETLPSGRSSKMYMIMKDLEGTKDEDNPTTIFKKGVKLGKQLEKKMSKNGVQIWKMMAEYWAETLIYITPSHATAKHHFEHLESGGEFLTHIWVLLSHAGILNLDREKDQGAKPAQPTAETV